MLRIYLDWNILTSMKRGGFPELHNFLIKNKEFTQVFYSSSHIHDFAIKNPELNDNVKSDLEFITSITDNQCFSIANGEAFCREDTPLSWYNLYIENDFFENDDNLLNILLEIDLSDYPQLNEAKDLLKEKVSLDDLRIAYPDIEGNTVFDLIMTIFRDQSKLMNTERFKDYQELFRSYLGINRDKIFASKTPYSDVETVINKSTATKDLGSILHNSSTISKSISNQCPDWFNKILEQYIFLDLAGYQSDEIKVNNKKNKTFRNLFNDATHSAFASQCHIYITHDYRNYKKTKEIYEKLDINTIVLTTNKKDNISYQNFINNEYLVSPNSIKELFNSCFLFMKKTQLEKRTANDNTMSIIVYLIFGSIWGVFNKILIQSEDNHNQIILEHLYPTNHQFIYFSVIDKIINILSDLLGIDCEQKKLLNQEEKEELNNNADYIFKRFWMDGNFLLTVNHSRLQLYLPSISTKM